MMNRSGIETYELLRLDEVALAGYFDLEDTRFEEWYEKNRAVGDRLYSAVLDKKIDLVALHLKPGGGRSDIAGMQANGFASPSGYTSNRFLRMSSMIFLRFTSKQNAAM